MKKITYIVTDPQGIHARPAGLLVKLTNTFQSDMRIQKGEKEVDARKILALMSLGIKQGEKITFTVDGLDEEIAAKAVEKFLNDNL